MQEPEINELLRQRLTSKGPKRILALDGGGIRGALTLGILEKIEQILAERHKEIIPIEKFRLYHYFDLIGGTSTGAIIAAALATGMKASDIKGKYKALGEEVFQKRKLFGLITNPLNMFSYSYHAAPLEKHLEGLFGDCVLGDKKNKTGLCVVAKRLDKFSTWPVTNNPNAKYFADNRFPLKEIVRASSAAPTYFKPEEMVVDRKGQKGTFVDGGVSIMNNPSLQLFLIATVKGYHIGGYNETIVNEKTVKEGIAWKAGEKDLFIVSVGTGRKDKAVMAQKWINPNVLQMAKILPDQFMNDANETVDTMMHLLGKFPPDYTPRKIDSEIGNMGNDILMNQKAFSYVRYNADLAYEKLKTDLGINDISKEDADRLTQMDDARNIDNLVKIGEAAATKVLPAHFPSAFNLTPESIYDEEIQKRNNP
jgi:uncharacterized protein